MPKGQSRAAKAAEHLEIARQHLSAALSLLGGRPRRRPATIIHPPKFLARMFISAALWRTGAAEDYLAIEQATTRAKAHKRPGSLTGQSPVDDKEGLPPRAGELPQRD